jgi:hypothetical protein
MEFVMKKYKGSQSIKSKSRKRSFGKTKPNYNSLIKEEWEDFLRTEGPSIKEKDPAHYYSLIGRKLPKKYQNSFGLINPSPPEIKISDSILKDEKINKKKVIKDDRLKKEALRKKNQEALARERKYIYPVNAHHQGNWRSIHSDEYISKTEKKYEYY